MSTSAQKRVGWGGGGVGRTHENGVQHFPIAVARLGGAGDRHRLLVRLLGAGAQLAHGLLGGKDGVQAGGQVGHRRGPRVPARRSRPFRRRQYGRHHALWCFVQEDLCRVGANPRPLRKPKHGKGGARSFFAQMLRSLPCSPGAPAAGRRRWGHRGRVWILKVAHGGGYTIKMSVTP